MNTVSIFLLVLAFCKRVCDGVPVKSKSVSHQSIPGFMRHLYNRCLAGKSPFSTIVHSNAAFGTLSLDFCCSYQPVSNPSLLAIELKTLGKFHIKMFETSWLSG
jgi:hypothetical protein